MADRLRELATRAARISHINGVLHRNRFGHLGTADRTDNGVGIDGDCDFEICPHPDCVLVREPLAGTADPVPQTDAAAGASKTLPPVRGRLQALAERLDQWAIMEDVPRSESEELLLDIQQCIESLLRDYEWETDAAAGAGAPKPVEDLVERIVETVERRPILPEDVLDYLKEQTEAHPHDASYSGGRAAMAGIAFDQLELALRNQRTAADGRTARTEAALKYLLFLAGVNGYFAWRHCLIGDPPPAIKEALDRASNPQVGDVVLETSTVWRWMQSALSPGPALGVLLREAREPIPRDDDEEDDDATEQVFYIRPLDGSSDEYRWVNASFIALVGMQNSTTRSTGYFQDVPSMLAAAGRTARTEAAPQAQTIAGGTGTWCPHCGLVGRHDAACERERLTAAADAASQEGGRNVQTNAKLDCSRG